MAKYCQQCGQKLSFFSGEVICKDCKTANQSALDEAEKAILNTKNITEQQLVLIKTLDKKSLINLYKGIYNKFEADSELTEQEMEILQKIQDSGNLTKEDVEYDKRILPYFYVNIIRKEGSLPKVKLQLEGTSQVVLKKDEIIHFVDSATLKEMKSISLGYSGGSHGVSIRVAKGISYRIGAHRGQVVREDRLIKTSRGALLITNQRFFLHPFPGYKPLNIPLNKILSYQCYGNGVEVYKEGREKGYFLAPDKSSSVEIIGLCLGHLIGRQS